MINNQTKIEELRARAVKRGEELLEEARERGADLLVLAEKRGKRAVGRGKDWVADNPAAAMGLAFVAGIVARSFLAKRSD
jgi:ElaB/YqjD/DUF883 family membrane-anchored ribosome-binding protein